MAVEWLVQLVAFNRTSMELKRRLQTSERLRLGF